MQKALQFTVIVCAVVFVFAKWTYPSSDNHQSEMSDRQSVDRNERSTPRSFVLPATPGIAFEQERQRAEKTSQVQIERCIGRLKQLGYDVGDSRPMRNVLLVEAIYTFQTKHQLLVTGHLDSVTMRAMGCS